MGSVRITNLHLFATSLVGVYDWLFDNGTEKISWMHTWYNQFVLQ